MTTQPPSSSRTPCTTRRSGRRVSVRVRCSAIRRPRTRIALHPPPLAVIRSGLRAAIARRAAWPQLRDGERHPAPTRGTPAPSGAGHHGGDLLEQRDVPFPAGERARELGRERASGGRHGPPVEQVEGQDEQRAATIHSPLAAASFPHRRRARPRGAGGAARPGGRAQGRRRTRRARSPAAPSRCCSSSRRRARARRSRRGSSSSAATRWSCGPGELQLTRGESAGDTARVLSRHVAAIGLRTGLRGDARRARRRSRPCRWSTCSRRCTTRARRSRTCSRCARRVGELRGRKLAYVGDGNNVARSLALIGELAGRDGRRRRAGRPPARAAGTGATLTDDPVAAVAGADAVYTDVWVSMSDDPATADARRAALGPYRVDDALLDRAAPGRVRAALPARAPGRGDHGRGALRRAPAHLGPGREPPPRAEGAARAARDAVG